MKKYIEKSLRMTFLQMAIFGLMGVVAWIWLFFINWKIALALSFIMWSNNWINKHPIK